MVPKDFTPSDLMGGAVAGEEEMGAETSSIDPNVTAEPERVKEVGISGLKWESIRMHGPCFAAPTLFRGTLTPSFIGTPERALGRLE